MFRNYGDKFSTSVQRIALGMKLIKHSQETNDRGVFKVGMALKQKGEQEKIQLSQPLHKLGE